MVKPSVVPSHSTSTICPSLLRTIPSVYIGLSLAYSLPNREVKIFTRSKGCIPVRARFPVFAIFSCTTTEFDFGQSQSLRILLSLIIFDPYIEEFEKFIELGSSSLPPEPLKKDMMFVIFED